MRLGSREPVAPDGSLLQLPVGSHRGLEPRGRRDLLQKEIAPFSADHVLQPWRRTLDDPQDGLGDDLRIRSLFEMPLQTREGPASHPIVRLDGLSSHLPCIAEVRAEEPRLHDGNLDVEALHLVTERLRVGEQGGLRGGIETFERHGDRPGDGSHGDDLSTPPLPHGGQDGLRRSDHAEEVRLELSLRFREGDLLETARQGVPRVVYEDVHLPGRLHHAGDACIDRPIRVHVEREHLKPVLPRPTGLATRAKHPEPPFAEEGSDDFPEAGRSTCDQNDPTISHRAHRTSTAFLKPVFRRELFIMPYRSRRDRVTWRKSLFHWAAPSWFPETTTRGIFERSRRCCGMSRPA